MNHYTKAHQAFNDGNFYQALIMSSEAINIQKHSLEETPYIKSSILYCHWQSLMNNKKTAFEHIIHLLKNGIDDVGLRNCLLSLIKPGPKVTKEKLLIGLGTGRCGSTSLTGMLNTLKGSYFSHEHPSIIPWQNGEEQVDWHITRMKLLNQFYPLVGDVAHWWLPYVERIIQEHKNIYFLVLRRDKLQTIKSFETIKGRINHWTDHDGIKFQNNFWDPCYPKYGRNLMIASALDLYWEEYYDTCLNLIKNYPDRIKIVETAWLNEPEKIKHLLQEFEIDVPDQWLTMTKNVGTTNDGSNFIPVPEVAF